MTRILDPTGMRVAWRTFGAAENHEVFREVLVFRFHGSCGPGKSVDLQPGARLGAAKEADDRVIPFGEVECDELRTFIAPASVDSKVMGRAMARVLAHELYHMLAGLKTHARKGIFRPAFSRAELVSESFEFDRGETDFLRAWVWNSIRAWNDSGLHRSAQLIASH